MLSNDKFTNLRFHELNVFCYIKELIPVKLLALKIFKEVHKKAVAWSLQGLYWFETTWFTSLRYLRLFRRNSTRSSHAVTALADAPLPCSCTNLTVSCCSLPRSHQQVVIYKAGCPKSLKFYPSLLEFVTASVKQHLLVGWSLLVNVHDRLKVPDWRVSVSNQRCKLFVFCNL